MVEQLINKALRYQDNAKAVISEMMQDSRDLVDYLIKPSLPLYTGTLSGVGLLINNNEQELSFNMTQNALSQFESKNKIPGGYVSSLSRGERWEKNLAAINMNHHSSNKANKKVLIRTVRDDVRGYLSTTYDRYSSVEVFKDFIHIAQDHNAVISNAYYNDISAYVEALVINPIIINGEQWLYGIQFRNSDFGGAALDMRSMFVKLICTNGMTRSSLLRKIHRASEIDSMNIQLSEETLWHNTQLKKNIIKDFSNHIFNKENIMNEVNLLNKVATIVVDIDEPIKKLQPLGASKTDVEEVKRLLMDNKANTGVQCTGTVMRVANAVSYLANVSDEADKIANYKDISGKLINIYSEPFLN